MRRACFLIIAGLAFVAAPAPVAAARTVDVSIKGFAFSRTAVSIRRDDRVRWTWRDGGTRHDVRSIGSPRFRSSAVKGTGTHTVRFTRRGTYRYMCSIHPSMRGRVVVR